MSPKIAAYGLCAAALCAAPTTLAYAAPGHQGGDGSTPDSRRLLAQAAAEEPADTEPGRVKVDVNAAERALERTLVTTGVLLMPAGRAEVEPGLEYSYREQSSPGVAVIDGNQAVASGVRRRHIFEANLRLRFGLPADTQFDLAVPYRYVDESRVTEVGGQPAREEDLSGSGTGDVRLSLAKGLLQESGWRPDLIARLTWNSGNGSRSDGNVSLGYGFEQWGLSLSAAKRQDPLVFTAGLSYLTTEEEEGFEPGDQIGLALGTYLAASPETSLRFVLSQIFIKEATAGGTTLAGSDQTAAILSLGASSIIARGTFLDVSADMGLTEAAPDYSVRMSFSYRFDYF